MATPALLLAGLTGFGWYLQNKATHDTERDNPQLRQKIDASEIPNRDNIYNNKHFVNSRNTEQSMMNKNFVDAMNFPYSEKNVLPAYYNTLYSDTSTNEEARRKSESVRRAEVRKNLGSQYAEDRYNVSNAARKATFSSTQRATPFMNAQNWNAADLRQRNGVVQASELSGGLYGISRPLQNIPKEKPLVRGFPNMDMTGRTDNPTALGIPSIVGMSGQVYGRNQMDSFAAQKAIAAGPGVESLLNGGARNSQDGPIVTQSGQEAFGLLSKDFRPEDLKRFGVISPGVNPKKPHANLGQPDPHQQGLELGEQMAVEGFNPTIGGPQHNFSMMSGHNNMTPFFGSRATQSIKADATQIRLEHFTGNVDSSTQFRNVHKQEVERDEFFKPTWGLTHPYGTPNLGDYGRDRYIASQKKTNIAPIPKQRVGRGLNQPGFSATPADGFHPRYRPPQYSVDELRTESNPKNIYAGRILPAQQGKRRGTIGNVYKHNPDTYYLNNPDRYFTTTGGTIKQTARENYKPSFGITNRDQTSDSYTGVKKQAQGGVSYLMPKFKRPLKETYYSKNPTAVTAQGHQPVDYDYGRSGKYGRLCDNSRNGGKYPYTQICNEETTGAEGYWASGQERDTTEVNAGNQRIATTLAQGGKSQLSPFDRSKITKRNTIAQAARETSGASGKVNEKDTMRPFDRMKPTKMDSMPNWKRETSGVSGKVNEKDTMRPFDRLKTTKVETLPFYKRETSGASGKVNENFTLRPFDSQRSTKKQVTTLLGGDHKGAADSIHSQVTSRENYNAAEVTNSKEVTLQQRFATPQGVKNSSGTCGVNISMRYRDNYSPADRTSWSGNAIESMKYRPSGRVVGTQQIPDTNTLGIDDRGVNQVSVEGIRQPDSALVSGFIKNPFTQPLNAIAPY